MTRRRVYRFGAFVLDPAGEALLAAGGGRVPLRPRAFALLRLLLENAGCVVTREDILAALWPRVFVTDDSITQCVHDIRRALGPGAVGALRTVHRRGYLLAADVVEKAPQPRTEPVPGARRSTLSLMVSDVRGFTSLCERLAPAALARITAAYFDALTGELRSAGATVVRCVGDTVVAYWGGPDDDPRHAAHACRGVLRAHAATEQLVGQFAERGWPPMPTTFGVHTGRAVVSEAGPAGRAVLGAAVNLTVRIEALNKRHGTAILVSDATRAAAGAAFVFRQVGLVADDAEGSVPAYALLGRRSAAAARPDLP
ncbi:adenylate/guanylate cyclase domain-containing protein [Paracraurococcus lichenis]|uniref:Winged helix-turn-helix domain-containing protein n=1 Tax=Paracraurococcus lichenis TaxID=3064888 RepID=A0ABT9DWG4_9PROT|nr:winged helix-turn-helix domain-containing protein [Paracraurococcus sp. LOR1-02]MDO9708213.1 winged helix-turn-helix domain-containing protein [Paracraurococcus sp. LOR1-02]